MRAAVAVATVASSLATPAGLVAQAVPIPAPPPAAADGALRPSVTVDGDTLTVHDVVQGALPRRFSLGCAPVAHRIFPAANGAATVHRLHVACATKVFRIELSSAGAVLVDEVVLAHAVVGYHETESDLWLELADGSGQSIRTVSAVSSTPTTLGQVPPPPVTSAPSAPGSPPIVGSVIEVRSDERLCVIDIGSEDGVIEGTNVAISSAVLTLDSPDVVVGSVRRTTENTALVELPYNALVTVGQRAEMGGRRSRSSRPRMGEWPYRAALRMNVRPALVLGNVGVTAAVDAEGIVRAGIGFFALRLSSSGFSTGRRDEEYEVASPFEEFDSGANFGFGGMYALAGVDFGLVSAALGVGASSAFLEDNDTDLVGPRETVLTLPFRARIGMEDGIHGEITQIIAYQGDELRWLGLELRGQVPVGRFWLFVDGAGGRLPTFHAVFGTRFALRGNGEPGSWSLRVGVGAAGTIRISPAESVRVGPTLQAGFETRL